MLKSIFKKPKPIIGMIHLKPLPGAPKYEPALDGMKKIINFAITEAEILESAGVDGVQIENYWDNPFLKGEKIGYETCACLSAAAYAISQKISIPFGLNLHLNGGKAALAAAKASGAVWIRIFEFVGAYISYTGLTEGIGGELARYRKQIGADEVKLFCDVHVKHGSHFIVNDRSVNDLANDAQEQGAECLIITGFSTGIPPSREVVETAIKGIHLPVLLGSGLNKKNARELLTVADGAIVGSAFKKDGLIKNKVDLKRTQDFIKEVERIRNDLPDRDYKL